MGICRRTDMAGHQRVARAIASLLNAPDGLASIGLTRLRTRGWRGWPSDPTLQIGDGVDSDEHQLPPVGARVVQKINLLGLSGEVA
jgi:hypothetical protein